MFPSSSSWIGAGSDDRPRNSSLAHSRGLELPVRLAALLPEHGDGDEIPLHFAYEARSL
jgi:hypothetical protein